VISDSYTPRIRLSDGQMSYNRPVRPSRRAAVGQSMNAQLNAECTWGVGRGRARQYDNPFFVLCLLVILSADEITCCLEIGDRTVRLFTRRSSGSRYDLHDGGSLVDDVDVGADVGDAATRRNL
jgi:hypothetical protein